MNSEVFAPRFNPKPIIRGGLIGRERQPVLVIDNVLDNADEMVDMAARLSFTPPTGSAYPGLNAPAPKAYMSQLTQLLRQFAESGYGVPSGVRLRTTSFLALATAKPSQLTPLQRIPHFDSPDPLRLAVVHYLCGPDHGGTGFFRHKSTGFETVNADQVDSFTRHITMELRLGLPEAYTGLNTPYFEPVEKIDAVFNRLIMYRNNCFHSALLEASPLSEDPRTGRLTLNSFISIDPT